MKCRARGSDTLTSMTTRTGRAAVGLATVLALLGACSDGDDDAESRLCDAQDDLDEDVGELRDLDLSSTSIDDVRDILDDIGEDLRDMRNANSDRLSPEIDALDTSVDDLNSAIGDLGSSSSISDAADTIRDALSSVADSAGDLKTAAKDDC